jgi:hypothetical protein
VVFPGTPTNYYTGPSAPQFFHGNAAWTVEAWIMNPQIAGEETVFAWGRRGGAPDGSNPAFIHGTSTAFGAISLWGAADVPWGSSSQQVATNTVAGQWTYVAYTYNPANSNVSVYVDGRLANSVTRGPLNLHSVDPSDPRNPDNFGRLLPFRIAAQSDPGGNATVAGTTPTSMAIPKVRAYDQALSAAQIAANYNAESAEFPNVPVITDVQYNPATGFISFDWVPAPGRSYAVEARDLTEPFTWTEIATGQTSGTFSNSTSSASSRLYRLRVENQ